MRKVSLYMPPDDYSHPAVDPVFEVGDHVVTDLGVGFVRKVNDYYYNRADKKVSRRNYTIQFGGSPSDEFYCAAVRFGYELKPNPQGESDG